MQLHEAEAWLESLINVERLPDLRRARLSLAPVRALLARSGSPQQGQRVLHLAGSKGKGSTALLVEALLRAAGLRVGTFTSPHMERWTERFRLDGAEVPGAGLAEVVDRLRPHVEALRRGGEPPSFFDTLTAAGLLLFADARVDVTLLEVGLGGRLDSTNAVDGRVACITSIELEHSEKLGSTCAAIAREKVGIARPGRPLVVGPLPAEAAAVVEARGRELGCPLVRLGREIQLEVQDRGPLASGLRYADGALRVEAELAWSGAHQARNAALALACARRLGVLDDAQLAELAPRALARVALPGRVEVMCRAPWVVVDGAHTADSAAALAAVLGRIPRRRSHLLLSISAGKNLPAIFRSLLPQIDLVTVTRAEPIRSLPPARLAAALQECAPELCVRQEEDPARAVVRALEPLEPGDLLCVTGSMYLAGIARRVLGKALDG